MTGAPRAFVTGIGGQDGSYLAERLLADGYDVHALAHGHEPLPFCPAGVVLHRGDLRDAPAMRSLIAQIEPQEVYNVAGMSSVAACWADPDACAAINGAAVATVLAAALECQERTGRQVRLVQASSAAMFGDPDHSPQHEDTPLRPVSPYGAAKAYGHHLVGVYRQRGLHAVGAILYNHESPRRPPAFVTRKITAGAAAIARGEADQLVLGNLDAVRDWGWAPDYVDAMVLAARAEFARDYVIATGIGHSVRDFVEIAFHTAGIEDWQRFVRSDPAYFLPADPRALVGDSRRIRADLGWAPQTSFTELIAAMVYSDLS